MRRLRRAEPGDAAALDRVCVVTGDAGRDATGHHGGDDDLLPDVYLRPYLARHPEFAIVVADGADAVGYVVAAPDTDRFEEWFAAEWWPRRAAAHEPSDDTAREAAARRPGAEPFAAEYPAHLHIDLLHEAQGQGWGRRLIEAACAALAAAEVPGVHLVASAENGGAIAFYPRVGFTLVERRPDTVVFARRL